MYLVTLTNPETGDAKYNLVCKPHRKLLVERWKLSGGVINETQVDDGQCVMCPPPMAGV